MSQCVKNNLDLLRALSKMTPKRRKKFLNLADKDLVQSLCECALNILKGNVQLKPCQKNSLRRHRHFLRKLVSSKGCWKRKRKYIVQKGSGILPALLAPIIGSIISHLVN